MRTIQQHIPGVIPGYMLERLAEHHESRDFARGTLDAMSALARHRGRAETTPQLILPVRKRRSVYDARHETRLPGRLVMSEHKARGNDVEVNQAYDGMGRFYDFMFVNFGWSSVDGRGLRLLATVHYDNHFDNGFWQGSELVLGDGDNIVFYPFTRPIDVIGHELGHGFIQYTAALGYSGQTGALNEHIADVIGSMLKQWVRSQTADQADWIIGQELIVEGINAIGLRSLDKPGTAYDDPHLGKDPQPANMRDYVETQDDNGGVHINSSIPSLAFYRSCVAVGGFSWEKIGQIWIYAVQHRLAPDAEFSDLASATVDLAGEKYSRDVQKAVADAWASVGLPVAPAATARQFAIDSRPPRPADRKPKTEAPKWRRRPAM